MQEPSVSVRNLTKSFGSRKVVDELSFEVEKGEVFAMPVVTLTAIAVLCGAVAIKTFRWE